MKQFSILVNTCDKFEDCWQPFFKLFKLYWPDYSGTIYLNTEYKDYSYEGLNIVALKVCQEMNDSHKITWSECLKRALDLIDTEIVLYMQEDYFLKDSVKNDIICQFVNLMEQNPIDCIHLTDQAAKSEKQSDFENLRIIPKIHQDRISCQAALWKKNALIQYLRPYETGWNFEWYGSKRAAILKHNFLVVDHQWVKLNQFEIIPYVFTGVIGGKWYKEVVPLFEKHGITINYKLRGFFERTKVSLKARIISKLKRIPIELRSNIDLFNLKLSNR